MKPLAARVADPYTTTVTSIDSESWDACPVRALPNGGVRVNVWVEGWRVTMDFDREGCCGDFRCDVADMLAQLNRT